MKNTVKRALVLILVLCGTMRATERPYEWFFVAESGDREFAYEIKRKTEKFTSASITVIGRQNHRNGLDVLFQKWQVQYKDCAAEYGMLYVYELDDSPLHKNPFVFGSGTLASEIAEAICNLRKKGKNKTH